MSAEEKKLHFDAHYREILTLKDGTRVTLRLLRVTDKDLLKHGFERLSPESRYLRFLTGKNSLSEKELRYLCEVDGVDHFAIGVVRHGIDGREEGLGVARFVRLKKGGSIAEPAITVIDEIQGKGLGTVLLHRLSAAARERGVDFFYTEFLADNERVRHMLNDIAPHAVITEKEGVIYAQFEVPDTGPEVLPSDADQDSILHRLLSYHAAGDLIIQIRRSLLLKWHN